MLTELIYDKAHTGSVVLHVPFVRWTYTETEQLSNLTSSCGLLTAQSIKCEIGLRFAKYFAEFIGGGSLRLVGL